MNTDKGQQARRPFTRRMEYPIPLCISVPYDHEWVLLSCFVLSNTTTPEPGVGPFMVIPMLEAHI
jgi:hypothetical protein